jgi:hypothetical protein
MRTSTALLLQLFIYTEATARPSLDRRDALGTATVDLASPQGTPQHLASGFIYGIPDTPNQIPDHFYSDIGFKYTRAGGSQLPAPARGWVHGVDEFNVRLRSIIRTQAKLTTCAESLCFRLEQLPNYTPAWRPLHPPSLRPLG